jgi:dynamin 1-like protein
VDRSHSGPAPVPTGRDISNAETAGPTGLMAGKRTLDGNNAAFDMKSLGKHIEAVSVCPLVQIPLVRGLMTRF